jgi:hypothetical protein
MFDIYAPVPYIFFPTMSSAIEPQIPNQGNLLKGFVIFSGKAQNAQNLVKFSSYFSSKTAILNHFVSLWGTEKRTFVNILKFPIF